jgi:hypothetical protein
VLTPGRQLGDALARALEEERRRPCPGESTAATRAAERRARDVQPHGATAAAPPPLPAPGGVARDLARAWHKLRGDAALPAGGAASDPNPRCNLFGRDGEAHPAEGVLRSVAPRNLTARTDRTCAGAEHVAELPRVGVRGTLTFSQRFLGQPWAAKKLSCAPVYRL